MALARKVNVNMFIMTKTVTFICSGRHEGIAKVDYTGKDKDRKGETGTDKDKQGLA